MHGDATIPAATAEDVLAIYLRAPEVHPYGIADVAQLWDCSRWWRAGEAVAGLIDLPGSPVPVLYAVSAGAGDHTVALLSTLEPLLPGHLMATGPRGMAAGLAPSYTARWKGDFVKMHLDEPARLPEADPRAVTIERTDLEALERLFATDESAGAFFSPDLLDTGLYLGRWDGDLLAACAGIHVVDEVNGVAAIGNVATHPAYRRRGLARALTATLCHRLRARVEVVGLNVRESNEAATRLYRSLGFRTVAPYEEAELVRRRSPS